MSKGQEQKSRHTVSVYDAKDSTESLLFTFVPKALPADRELDGPFARIPQYILLGTLDGKEAGLSWKQTSDDPGGAKGELEQEALKRLAERKDWIDRVSALVSRVNDWAMRMGWATKRIEKKLEDSYIGKHTVPALLMQEDTVRVLLEPVARIAPGASGLVDLYLMPGYDDIASLYFRQGEWYLNYRFPDHESIGTIKNGEPRVLNPETLGVVLGEMKKHGG